MYESFMTGISDAKEIHTEMLTFGINKATKYGYIQLTEDSTGEQAACCMVDWIYNKDLGGSREEI